MPIGQPVGKLGHQRHAVDAVDVRQVTEVRGREPELGGHEPELARTRTETLEDGEHRCGLAVLERSDADVDGVHRSRRRAARLRTTRLV